MTCCQAYCVCYMCQLDSLKLRHIAHVSSVCVAVCHTPMDVARRCKQLWQRPKQQPALCDEHHLQHHLTPLLCSHEHTRLSNSRSSRAPIAAAPIGLQSMASLFLCCGRRKRSPRPKRERRQRRSRRERRQHLTAASKTPVVPQTETIGHNGPLAASSVISGTKQGHPALLQIALGHLENLIMFLTCRL